LPPSPVRGKGQGPRCSRECETFSPREGKTRTFRHTGWGKGGKHWLLLSLPGRNDGLKKRRQRSRIICSETKEKKEEIFFFKLLGEIARLGGGGKERGET